jgi:fluoride ion exporter CrcB/FEX
VKTGNPQIGILYVLSSVVAAYLAVWFGSWLMVKR